MTEYTILFADIAGSTALYENLGDTQAETIISTVLNALSSIVKEHNGQVIKTIGDEIMCQFPSSGQAIHAAAKMHEYTSRETIAGINHHISIRVGAHVGAILHIQGDIFGDTVNVCARIAALARPGKTMISEETFRSLPVVLQNSCRHIMETHLKGKEQPVKIYDVVWENTDQLTRLTDTPHSQDSQSKLILNYQDQRVELTQGVLTIGRGLECNLNVQAPQASRCHCEIRLNGNKFSLSDNSTNGTFILQNSVELRFHQESVPLLLSGIISLGQSSEDNSEFLIHFSIESDQ